MSYKILYIEDLNPGSIIHDLKRYDFTVEHHQPLVFEETLKAVSGYDLLLIDFRLTEKSAIFDAPTIAQTLRTLNSSSHKDIPIVLISSESNIRDYYKDLTSQDLFDISLTKLALLENLDKYSTRFKSIIAAYNTIKSENFEVNKILKISEQRAATIDYRIYDNLNNEIFKNDIFAFSSFIVKKIICSIGVLIGEDVLSARLGVSKSSPDWDKLKSVLSNFKYEGIYADSYSRWWSDGLIEWWKEHSPNTSLRKLNASQRVEKLIEITNLDLVCQNKMKYAKSSSFWTICKETHLPIDPVDGLELTKKILMAWQETEYLSIKAGIEPEKFDDKGHPLFFKYLKPIEKKRLKSIIKDLENE